jgi:hypothetical protein
MSSAGDNEVRIVGRIVSAGVDPKAARAADHDVWGRMATGRRMRFQMRAGAAPDPSRSGLIDRRRGADRGDMV